MATCDGYAVKIRELTARLPKSKIGLTSQLRRAISISSNLAEGGRKPQRQEKLLYHIRGSLLETSSQLIYGHHVGYFSCKRLKR